MRVARGDFRKLLRTGLTAIVVWLSFDSTDAASFPSVSRAATAESATPKPKPHGSHSEKDDATVRHRFADAKKWSKLFDDPSRGEWQKPAELVRALGIRAGDRVADLGAGTGYFESWLGEAVGSSGAVYAVEVETELVRHLRARAEKEKTANVIPVLGSFDNPRLPARSIDLVLVVDTYHHIDGRIEYFRRLRSALSERGRVAIVDFEKRPLPVGPGVDHKLEKKVYLDEMSEAGYGLDSDLEELLPYQYVLVFRPSVEKP